jgi:integrase
MLPGQLPDIFDLWRWVVSKTHEGSLGYQMMKALQIIFRPGASRHNAKKYHRDAELITGISTMRCMSADVHQFARFIRTTWPEVKHLPEVRSEMALAYIEELEERERSGGRIARVCSSLRKLDLACRKAGIFRWDAPPLLPYKDQGGPGGYHSHPKPIPYSREQAQMIITWIAECNPTIMNLLTLMWKVGLRITEATYLRAQDIDLARGVITLNQEGNTNRTKGGRPRIVRFLPEYHEFLAGLKNSPENQPTGHLFLNRRGLPGRAREVVRNACGKLGIPYLGTHGFRKTFSVEDYHHARSLGADDRQALLATSHQLGHNRVDVTHQSYIPEEERERSHSKR